MTARSGRYDLVVLRARRHISSDVPIYELTFDLALAGALVWLGRRGGIRAPTLCAIGLAWFTRTQRGCAGARDGKEVDDAPAELDRV